MINLRYILSVMAILLSLSAAGREPLTLDVCRDMAMESNKQMKIAESNREKASIDVLSYKANFLPNFSATGNYLYTGTSMRKTIPGSYLPTFVPDAGGQLVPNILTTIDGVPLFKEYAYFPDMDIELKLSGTYTAGIRAEQPIYMGGKVASAYRMSRIGEEIAGFNAELTRTEVILMTDEAYWSHLKAVELEKTALKYHEVVRELLRNVENAREAGMKSLNDVLKVRVKLNEAELQLKQASNAVRLSRMNLCHVVGLPLRSEISISVPDDESGLILDISADISARPEYAILSRQAELKDEQVKLVRSDYLPNVGVMANFGYANGLKLNGDKLLDKTSFSAVVSVSVPLFHWGEGRNKVRSVRVERFIAQTRLDDASEQMELELTRAFDNYEEARLEVALTARSVEQAEENLKLSQNHYEAGFETLADHLEAQTLWQRAWSDYINAQNSLRMSESRYLKAAGQL